MIPPPPALTDLRAGTQLVAGLGHATVIADLDFETFSEAGFVWEATSNKWTCLPRAPQGRKGLGVVGVAVYAMHPTTEILSLAYDLKDGRGRRHWKPGDYPPTDLFEHIAAGGLIEAWNSGFEFWIWNHVGVRRYGWPKLPIRQLRCAMAKARAYALPGKLEDAGKVLRLAHQKDPDGKRLLDKFSIPRNPTKADNRRRITPVDDPADGARLYAYNGRDIETEAEASSLTPDLTGEELEFWLCDQEINYRGVAIDTKAVADCIVILNELFFRYDGELHRITNGAVERSSQTERLKGWLAGRDVVLYSMDEEHVEDALKRLAPTTPEHRALTIRSLTGSASIKKLFAMANQVSPFGRLHDLFVYHGNRTGRTAGQAVQPTNMPKAGPDCFKCPTCARYSTVTGQCPWCGSSHTAPPLSWEICGSQAIEDVLEVCASRSLDLLEMFFDDASAAIVGCLRGMFIAANGHDLVASDYSAIESVVTAALAGEEWRLEVFRTHGKIYEMSASKITGIPFQEYLDYRKRTGSHHPTRQTIGKVAELASGFGGWIGAWITFGADAFFTEEQIRAAVIRWREESPMIVELWGGQGRGWPGRWNYSKEYFGLEGMAVQAILNPGVPYSYCAPHPDARSISYVVRGDVLYCILPSGRPLTYHRPRLEPSSRRDGELQITFMGWNTNPQMGAVGWVQMETYGGKLTENVVQAVSRDILRHAIVNMRAVGYPIVLHVYDEIVAEIRQDFGSVEEFERIMSTLPDWCKGWPVKAAGGWRGRRYRKD